MELKSHDLEGVKVIELTGEFDYVNAEEIRSQIIEMIDQGFPKLIINMEEVSYIDSTGIGILISSWTRAKAKNTKIFYAALKGSVKQVIHLCRLHMVLPIAATIEEALKD